MEKKASIPAVAEIVFDIAYLCFAIGAGIYMLAHANGWAVMTMYGSMALTLGCGDAFHLAPRIIAQATNRMDRMTSALGFGKFITSITMTAFYVMLFYVGQLLAGRQMPVLWKVLLWSFATIRIVLCMLPQNKWQKKEGNHSWAIYRNIPFVLLGLLVLIEYFQYGTGEVRFMWLAILLSFAFYLPVVLLSDKKPAIGMLMMPKTCAYVWIICMGLQLL